MFFSESATPTNTKLDMAKLVSGALITYTWNDIEYGEVVWKGRISSVIFNGNGTVAVMFRDGDKYRSLLLPETGATHKRITIEV